MTPQTHQAPSAQPLTAWLVLVGARHVDTVFFRPEFDAGAVRRSLIEHDLFPHNIRVVRRA